MGRKNDITVDDWLDALNSAEEVKTVGMTSAELAVHAGINVETMRKRIKRMIDAGVVKFVGYRKGVNAIGRGAMYPVYVLSEKKK